MDYKSIIEKRRLEDNNRLINNSFESLLLNIENKVMTTGIGAISKFESFFGKIWGKDLKDSELSENQRLWKDVWEQCRNEILNHINFIKRGMKKVISPYEIKWVGYKVTFNRGKNNEKQRNF